MASEMIDRLAINVNGLEKYATGLTKSTTIDDIKYAMLTASQQEFFLDTATLEDFGVFERWQGNERILDGRIKIYKLIRLWQSLPGDQLSQVKFFIKKRKPQFCQADKIAAKTCKLAFLDRNVVANKTTATTPSGKSKFGLCSLSPAMQKTWNYEKLKRKSSYVNKQLELISGGQCPRAQAEYASSSSSDVDYRHNDESSSGSDVDEQENEMAKTNKRYASIKRYNRSKKCTIKKTHEIKKSFIDLVNKQNEIIDKQLDELTKPKHTDPARCKSLDRQTTDDAQINEIFNDYLNVENCLAEKLQRIETLKSELNTLVAGQCDPASAAKIVKTNKKLQNCMELETKQNDKINNLNLALNKIDDVICLKTKFIQSLEDELKRLELLNVDQIEQPASGKNRPLSMCKSSSTTSSSTSSSSSLFTSISSISSANSYHHHHALQTKPGSQMTMIKTTNVNTSSNQSYVSNDNESDTGISSANSDDFNTQQLETLV